jgi:hypothetical protein
MVHPPRVKIADLVFECTTDRDPADLYFEDGYRPFATDAPPDVHVTGHYDGLPRDAFNDARLVFESSSGWNIYRRPDAFLLALRHPTHGPDPYRLAVFSLDFRRVDVCFPHPCPDRRDDGRLPHPLCFPVFHVLMLSLLAQGIGINLHGSGIDDAGRGLLFSGSPEAGKTTMARLWEPPGTILNDERIIIRPRDDGLWIFGTPWHGEHVHVSPRAVPLRALFFIEHAPENRAHPLPLPAAVTEIARHAYHPYWDPDGMRFTLEFFTRLAAEIPCFRLGFRPDPSAVTFVRNLLESPGA